MQQAVTAAVDVVALALGLCARVAKADKDKPLLGAVALSTEEGRLHLYATDERTSIRVSLPCEGELGTTRAVNTRQLKDLLSTAGARQGKRWPMLRLALVESGAKLEVAVASRRFEVETCMPEDMESPARLAKDAHRVVYGMPAELRAALEFALPATAREVDSPVLGGALFTGDAVAGANGLRTHLTWGLPDLARPRGATLPVSALKALVAALAAVKPAQVQAAYDDGTAAFFFGFTGVGGLEVSLTSKTPAQDSPDLSSYRAAREASTTILISTAALAGALALARKVSVTATACVLMASPKRGEVLVRAAENLGPACSEVLNAQVSTEDGKDARLLVNPHYLLEALGGMGPEVRLEWPEDASLPLRLTGEHPQRVASIIPKQEEDAAAEATALEAAQAVVDAALEGREAEE